MNIVAADATRRAFCARFSGLHTWSVAGQFSVSWNWAEEFVKPLSSILLRRSEVALEGMAPETLVNLLTIRFDGSIEAREPVRICDVKGRLFRVHPGDVVFSKIDVRNGAIGCAPNDIPLMCVTAEFPVYSVNDSEADSNYVKLLFRTDAFRKILNSMISGASGRKRIQPSQLEAIKVPIPSMSSQRKIVDHWLNAVQARVAVEDAQSNLVSELNEWLVRKTNLYSQVIGSKVFVARYENAQQWDAKAGRAAAFIAANPDFVRLGDYTEECTDIIKPWAEPDKEWMIYGVNNRGSVFLSSRQRGCEFNAPYKIIKENWFFHNPTRANVGSLGIVPSVPKESITSPEYQVWRLKGGLTPGFVAILLRTEYFLSLVEFSRVGGVKQRMYYSNLAEIRLPIIPEKVQRYFSARWRRIASQLARAETRLKDRRLDVEDMIIGLKRA
ncbi:restriction endonuclease subunit S [Stenotrophomonas pavanii]|uniref:restriction endonuclease subunit S n=1 Tax=Stenotrophomonas pavanii TaxID=487698 RepID=UPI00289443E4|nr:restriction endonuclease subunit S [Stenotrophomonas pavanii]MDT3457456.1 restriction endonuclease subunit S [Stenotrophomonas pavanii]MDT3466032.1 restriction endonuclease subunit S [Stenotrophomonas pavanii]